MKFRLIQLIILSALSINSIVLIGCSTSKSAIIDNKKFHIYECKSDKLICNLADSTTVVVYPGPDQDKSTLALFENGTVTVKMLVDLVYQNNYDWIDFDFIQPEIARTYSDTCKEFIEDEKTLFVLSSSSKVDADGSTIHSFSFITGKINELSCFELKQMKQNHFAIRFSGVVL